MKTQEYFKKERKAIQEDKYRRFLFRKLFEVYANAMPMVLKTDDGDIQCVYSDSVEETAEKIREEIRLRDRQVFNAIAQ